jgi:hypothetical protein
MSKNPAVQIKIVLKNSKPPIWRRVLVDSSITFEELHYTIQISMGWGIYHLYEFNVDNYRIGVVLDDGENLDYVSSDVIDAANITLAEVISGGVGRFTYEYDFGDSWIHNLEIEKIMPLEPKTYYPICLKGKNNCPPEDIGGIPGYNYLLEVLKDKKHPEYRSMKDWLGGSFDPAEFDLEETNMCLREIQEIMDEEDDEIF